MTIRALSTTAILLTTFISAPALANWTFNLGYHNPPGAKVGANFLYIGSDWGFELGLGWLDLDSSDKDGDNDDDSTTAQASGAVSVKYFLSSGAARFYVQAGMGAAIGAEVGDDNDLGAGLGGPYGGLGLLLGSPKFYGYAAYNIGRGDDGFAQAGIGFDIF